ncbi:MAG: cation-translocating P-type ATPase [Deltaproteobacteria bacterium]|nr:cation-translocating P-type ATPase [Deltaproteobacteria bacterium]
MIVENLKTLRSVKAHIIKGQQTVDIDASQIKKGDLIRILPGETIPCDGEVVAGTTRVDESMFTGDSLPQLKAKGETLTGGSMNQDGAVTVHATQTGETGFLEQFIQLVEKAVESCSKAVRWHRIRGLFGLLTVSALATAGFLIFKPATSPVSFAVLIIPTALPGLIACIVLPKLLRIALDQTIRQGILLKDASLFSLLAKMKTLFFDKTGTLTKGEFVFSQLLLEQGVNQETLLSAVFSLEASSSHPLAQGMKTHPWHLEIPKYKVKNFQSHPGLGLCGTINEPGSREHFVVVGNMRFLKRFQMQISRAMRERAEELEMMGETVLVCGWDGLARGIMSFVDTFRTDVKPMLDQLTKLHIKPIMITGDHGQEIAHLTYAHGLNQIYERCLPEEKINKIKKAREGGKIAGMVGSLLDESPVLAASDIGMIIGSGTRKISGVAVSFPGEKFSKLTTLLIYSRKTARTMKTIVWAGIVYHAVIQTFSFLGYLNPVFIVGVSLAAGFFPAVYPLRLKKPLTDLSLSASSPKQDSKKPMPLPGTSLPSHRRASALPR